MSDQNPSTIEDADQPEVVNISHADVDTVTAEMVRMHQSNARTVNSDDVEMNITAAADVHSQTLSARQSLIGGVRSDTAQITGSVVGGVRGSNVDVEGVLGAAAGETISVQNARVGLSVAREIRGERVESLVLLAGRVEGEVHTAVDTRGAIVMGLVGGLIAGLVFLVGRTFLGRDEN